MVVVDVNVIAAFWLGTARSERAIRARRRDRDWVAPTLWRSEFRSVLRKYLLKELIGLGDAIRLAEKAEAMFRSAEYSVASADIIRLVQRTGRSSYDCEYVALAESLNVSLVTGDRQLSTLFPTRAVLLEDFAA